MDYSNIIELIKNIESFKMGGLMVRVNSDCDLQLKIIAETHFLDEYQPHLFLRVKCIRENIKSVPVCLYCSAYLGKIAKFCSPSCNSNYYYKFIQTEDKKKSKAEKNSKSYWNLDHQRREDIKAVREKTLLEKYGVNHNFLIPGARDKIAEKNIQNWGFPNPTQNDLIKEKIKNTNQKKYGHNSPSANTGVRFKINSTLLEKFGSLAPPFLTYKSYEFPSGKKVKYLGWENKAFDYLLQSFTENDFVCDQIMLSKVLPEISYIDRERKERRYFPDIFIPSLNKIIEVKSEWTHKTNLEINNLKKDACQNLGFLFEFWIFQKNKKVPRIL